MRIEGYHCKTHSAEITHEMKGDPTLDNIAREMMKKAAEDHKREHGGKSCTIIPFADEVKP